MISFFSFLKNIHVSSLKKKTKHFSQYTLNKIELWNFSILQLCSSIFKSYCSWFMAHKFYDHMVHVLIFGTYEYHIDNKSILNKNIFKVFKLAFHSLRLNTNFSTFKNWIVKKVTFVIWYHYVIVWLMYTWSCNNWAT